jgi:type II secretory pathway component PulF
MMTLIAIVYVILVVQLTLGVSMIATASVAANRRINAPHRSVDIAFLVLGCASAALGVWAIVMLAGVVLFHDSGAGNEMTLIYIGSLLYVVPLFGGGLLQARVARSLMKPPPLEEQRKDEWRISLLRVTGWALALMPIGMPLGIFVGVYFAIAAVFGSGMRVQQESLLLILAIAVKTQSPLAEEIDVLADSSRGRFRTRLRKLADRLRNGERLSDALGDLPGLVPPRTVTAIRVGEDLGNLVPVIQQEASILRRREESRLEGRFSAAGMAFYLWCMVCVIQGVVGFLMYWIVPKLKKIFQDFNTPLPVATKELIHFSDFCSDHAGAIALWANIVIWGGAIILVRRGGWAGIDWGFFSVFYPRLETPGVLRNLAQAVTVRRPLATALSGLELHHRRRNIRNRIRRVRDEVVRGRDCFAPLCQNGLITKREADALVSAERAGNLAWALDGIADNIESRQRAREQMIAEVVQPAIVMGVGFVILGICIALFIPLVHLIGSTELW